MDARLVASRLPGIPMYGQPFNAPPFPGYLPYGPADASAFYSPLPTGENAEAWRAGLTQAAAAAYYDPTLAAHYGYGYGPMGLSDGARRKNATRETTSTLKAWLNEHRKNPYPTKGEKIMLAIITKMTLTQVSTWFANARRRLKKENKMTWSPRNRCGDEDDDDIMDGDDDNNLNNNSNSQMREGHTSAGERSGSRCSSPNPTISNPENQRRVSGFDLPQQGTRHPFLPRPEITGSFRIQGPVGGPRPANEVSRRRSRGDEDEEIDLESVDDERKELSLVKRSHSTEGNSADEVSLRKIQPGSPNTTSSQFSGLFPNVPHHHAFHPNTPNPAATASLLARHHLHQHSLSSQSPSSHRSISQQSSFGHVSSKISRRDSASPRSHPYLRNAVSSPTSSVASAASATSPSKPKIWSLADVATSNESSKNCRNDDTNSITSSTANSSLTTSPTPGMAVFPGRSPVYGVQPHHQSPLNPEAQATIRNWMDGVMQQKMAAAAAAAAAMSGGQAHPSPFFPGGLLPPHLAAALNPAALAVAASLPRGTDGARFPHPFPGFAELAAAQRAQMAVQVAEIQSQGNSITVINSVSPTTPTSSNKPFNTGLLHRHRIVSNDEKNRSLIVSATSPAHSDGQSAEIANFTALNARPASNDSGIASAETSKDSLTQGSDSASTK
ncbi:uncharacterized protein LOC120341074 [Styela clava]